MREITVVGSANVDMVIRGARLPRPGETVMGGEFARSPGGKGANQAVAAAAMGAKVRLVGCIGHDEGGRWLTSCLAGRGVDVSGLRRVDAPTGVALILVDGRGQNMISVAPGANLEVRADGEYDLLLTQLETPWLLPRARTVILDPAPARRVPLAGVDWLLPNAIEAEQLTGQRDLFLQKAALEAAGARHVLIKLGEHGVFDGELHPAFPVEAVDTVGAGDVFAGALAVALAEERPDAIRFAQAAAALAVLQPGAQMVPTRAEVEAFLAGAR